MSLRDLFKRRNKCGTDGFTCGTCKVCSKKEDEKWQKIWDEKYSDQERKYYEIDPFLRQTEYSPGRSSLSTNEPIEDWDAFLSSEERTSERLRADGRKKRLEKSKSEVLSRA